MQSKVQYSLYNFINHLILHIPAPGWRKDLFSQMGIFITLLRVLIVAENQMQKLMHFRQVVQFIVKQKAQTKAQNKLKVAKRKVTFGVKKCQAVFIPLIYLIQLIC